MAKYFWLLLTIAAVGWYSTITVYVAVKGFGDIKSMLRRLAANQAEAGDVSKND